MYNILGVTKVYLLVDTPKSLSNDRSWIKFLESESKVMKTVELDTEPKRKLGELEVTRRLREYFNLHDSNVPTREDEYVAFAIRKSFK